MRKWGIQASAVLGDVSLEGLPVLFPLRQKTCGERVSPFGTAAWCASVRTLLCEICTAFDAAAVSRGLGLCEVHSSLI